MPDARLILVGGDCGFGYCKIDEVEMVDCSSLSSLEFLTETQGKVKQEMSEQGKHYETEKA